LSKLDGIETGRNHLTDSDLETLIEFYGLSGVAARALRELRHSCISILSGGGLTIEDISKIAGHRSTGVTETVYWHELRPRITEGAAAMDRIFDGLISRNASRPPLAPLILSMINFGTKNRV
jgi:hypothetical protein